MTTKAKKLRDKIGSLHIQSHSYPSRREIIEKCESGFVRPLLKTKGMGRSHSDNARFKRLYDENFDRIFGSKPLNVSKVPIT